LPSTGSRHALSSAVLPSFAPRISKGIANEHCIVVWLDGQDRLLALATGCIQV
jgi:hypothetical protein